MRSFKGFTGIKDQGDEALIRILNGPYQAREFQYIKFNVKDLLFMGPLTALVVGVLRAVLAEAPAAKHLEQHPAYERFSGVVI